MNLVLFEPEEIGRPLLESDPRVVHIRTVLRRETGERFAAGLTDGTPGDAVLQPARPGSVDVAFFPGPELTPRPPLIVLIGLPRPQTARDVLRDATTLGATELHFVSAERTDPNYAQSSLWTTGEWQRHIRTGAMQACDPRLPVVTWQDALSAALARRPSGAVAYGLDNYEPSTHLARVEIAPKSAVVLAIGPERGWGARDRDELREAGVTLAQLGPSVLRTETAVVAALTLVSAARQRA